MVLFLFEGKSKKWARGKDRRGKKKGKSNSGDIYKVCTVWRVLCVLCLA